MVVDWAVYWVAMYLAVPVLFYGALALQHWREHRENPFGLLAREIGPAWWLLLVGALLAWPATIPWVAWQERLHRKRGRR